MEIVILAALVMAAFWLGACPFSLIIGRCLLHKDIRRYGDANPGAWNVIRAGGVKVGLVALVLDIAKGVPFVLIAGLLEYPESAIMAVGFGAILGHAYSPFLKLRGGKAVAVTYGVLVAFPDREMLTATAACMVIGVLLIEVHAWVVILGTAGSLGYLIVTGSAGAQIFFLSAVLVVFILRYFPELKVSPGYKGMLVHWLQAVRH